MSIKQTCLLAVPDNDPVKVCGVFQNFIKQYVDANPDYQEVFRKTLLLKQLRSDLLSDDASLVPFFDNAVGYLYRTDEKLYINFQSADEVNCGSRCDHLRGQNIEFAWDKIYTAIKKK